MKDPNYLLNLEKAIIEKYGEQTVKNPKADWSQEKEAEYLKQIKELSKLESLPEQYSELTELKGVLIPKKLITKRYNNNCHICKCYSFSKGDDIYLSKYETCFKCFIQHIEGREQQWLTKKSPKN